MSPAHGRHTGHAGHGHAGRDLRASDAGLGELNPFLEGWLEKLGGEGLVLDLGCGHGYWLRTMTERGFEVVGVEPGSDRVWDAAGAMNGSGRDPAFGPRRPNPAFGPRRPNPAFGPRRPRVAAGDGARLPLRDGSVSLVWCIHVLHHLDDPAAVLAEVRRVLRPGGHLILAETVEDNPLIRVGRRIHPEWDGVPVVSRFTAGTLLGLLMEARLAVVERRQHSLVSFAAWTLPRAGRKAWLSLSRLENRLPPWTARWGAHLECVAQRP